MSALRALGKRSVASVLDIVMMVLIILGWIGFILVAAILAITFANDISGGQLFSGFLEVGEEVQTGTYIVGFLALIVVFAGFILIARQLRKILRTLIEGDPFVPENARRLTTLALIVGGMELARYLIGFAAMSMDVQTKVNFDINLAAWASVVILWVLSQVFAEGTRLREEEKMTI